MAQKTPVDNDNRQQAQLPNESPRSVRPPHVLDLLAENVAQTRLNAVLQLGGIDPAGPDGHVRNKGLIWALQDTDNAVVEAAIRIFGESGAGGVPVLLAALEDDAAEVRMASEIAARALAALGPVAVPGLIRLGRRHGAYPFVRS